MVMGARPNSCRQTHLNHQDPHPAAHGSHLTANKVPNSRERRNTEPEALDSLWNYWRAQGVPPRRVLPTTHRWAKDLERFRGWVSPSEYRNRTANFLALQLQWDVALALVATWDCKTQERFRNPELKVNEPTQQKASRSFCIFGR
ncbi:hypothetical protein ElyMa_001179700 [Elysia marginata]|uniref:Core-binding (CB) domain-containing protein n=1 Tax=Elysia marginata TaxID=1093978 RepID=A0AAV4I3W2_9GAST|nr:hypothetical protein ElyMa_001179700 [Elysia marginata]